MKSVLSLDLLGTHHIRVFEHFLGELADVSGGEGLEEGGVDWHV